MASPKSLVFNPQELHDGGKGVEDEQLKDPPEAGNNEMNATPTGKE